MGNGLGRTAEGGGGRRRVGQDWEAKCRRPNNGQAASTDLPTPSSYEASTCFPSVPRISGLQFARCGWLTRCTALCAQSIHGPSIVPPFAPPSPVLHPSSSCFSTNFARGSNSSYTYSLPWQLLRRLTGAARRGKILARRVQRYPCLIVPLPRSINADRMMRKHSCFQAERDRPRDRWKVTRTTMTLTSASSVT